VSDIKLERLGWETVLRRACPHSFSPFFFHSCAVLAELYDLDGHDELDELAEMPLITVCPEKKLSGLLTGLFY
jgi:hypothetical protein